MPEPAAQAPASPVEEPTRVDTATSRRGTPWLIALGTCIAALGLLVILYTYYAGYLNESLPAPGGIRADYMGILLLLVGAGVAAAFAFLPKRAPLGLSASASKSELDNEIQRSAAKIRTNQVLVGVGLGLIGIGFLIMIYYVYVGYTEDEFRSTIVGGYDIPTHYLGAFPLLVGLLWTMFYWGGISAGRHRHNLATVAAQRVTGAPPVPAAPNTLSSGVTEAEVQNLMRRLDGLMAQLPDSSVTEFSKTPEADTYLKLLGT